MLTKNITNPYLKELADWVVTTVTALILFMFLRHFVFTVAKVDGYSMEPTLSHGDRVFLSKVGYWFGEPEVGDIIAFPYRNSPEEFYIKRIWGVPGDVVDFNGSGFTVNGNEADFSFAQVDVASGGDNVLPITLGVDEFFVLGDNLNFSKDSRYQTVGFISKRDMLGRVVIRIWPIDRFGQVE